MPSRNDENKTLLCLCNLHNLGDVSVLYFRSQNFRGTWITIIEHCVVTLLSSDYGWIKVLSEFIISQIRHPLIIYLH